MVLQLIADVSDLNTSSPTACRASDPGLINVPWDQACISCCRQGPISANKAK